jgi:hypothetical protein
MSTKHLYLVTPPDDDGGVDCDTLVVAEDALSSTRLLAEHLGLTGEWRLAFTDEPVEESWHVRLLPDPNSCLPGLLPWDNHSYFILEE